MTKQYKLINNLLGWGLAVLASAVYLMTAEPTASWWDCGEYIATTYKMLVGHPPGAPTFQIIGHFFSMFSGGDVSKVALCINSMSAICSGLTIMFLFWTITMFGKKLVAKLGEMTTGRQIAIFGAALVGALTYTFTDTFWFSAVEGEVYAMSSFFTALVFWCILKWDEEYDKPKSNVNPNRWIILIAYLMGLSIGVHLLNLLTLPAIVLVIYFKLSPKATAMGVVQTLAIISFFLGIFFSTGYMLAIWAFITTPLLYLCFKKGTVKSKAEWGVFLSLVLSFALIGIILYGIIPGIVSLASKFEIFFINSIGLPFNSGTIIFFLLLFGLVAWALIYGYKNDKKILLTGVYSFLLLLVGYSTFFTLVIRSNANPTIDENNPEDAVALLSYLNREQYGSNPLIYGQSYNTRVVDYDDGKPFYVKDEKSKKYIISDHKKRTEPVYLPEGCMFFPRMWDSNHKNEYVNWLNNQYNSGSGKDKEVLRYLKKDKVPTHQLNVKFLHSYQLNYMYFRYFMWNFSGRQNDIQGRGDVYNGNWITGIPFIDDALVGNQKDLPVSMERPGHNVYYMLPLLLGLIGIYYYSKKDGKNSFIVLLLFAMTGLAIAFYLNMYAFQPRERDYAFAASFYAFCIWIGFGVFGLYSFFDKMKRKGVQIGASLLVTLICIGLVPGILASENWDDHDRSNRYTALAIAKNYLDSCAPNAILFTLGDNDTFPLWYAQEVEGYRTDVRVCNLSLLSTSWYVDQMKRKAYNSEPLPISMTWDQYKDGTRDLLVLDPGNNQFINLKDVVNYFKSPEFDNTKQLILISGDYQKNGRAIPASFSLPVDKAKVLANGTVKPENDSLIVDKLTWNMKTDGQNIIFKAYMIMMDILSTNNWERPVYYATTTGSEAYLGLEDYFQLEGLAYRLVPIKTPRSSGNEIGRIEPDVLYNNLMNVFNDHTRSDKVNNPNAPKKEPYQYLWGGLNDPRVYNPEDNLRLVYQIRYMYLRLAERYILEKQFAKAEEVLDQGNKVLDDKVIPYKLTYQWFYSITSNYYINGYFKLNTPSGNQKGMKMANRMLDYLIEDFTWFEKCNDHSLAIQSENITNNITILNQLTTVIDEGHLKLLQPKFKQIKLTKTGNTMIDLWNANIDHNMRNLEESYQSIGEDFQKLQQLIKVAQLTGNNDIAQKAMQVTENQVAVMERINPQIGNMFRSSFVR